MISQYGEERYSEKDREKEQIHRDRNMCKQRETERQIDRFEKARQIQRSDRVDTYVIRNLVSEGKRDIV